MSEATKPIFTEVIVPAFDIRIQLLNRNPETGKSQGGILQGSTLDCKEDPSDGMSAIESLVLAHAVAGVDVTSPAYVEGLVSAAEGVANHE